MGTLSGGQRAQLALALTLAKRPRLLLLDEPVAALDPLARRQFLAHLAEAVADTGLTVVLSSHLIADLERTCDHLILLAAARVQLCGDIDTLLAEHQVLIGPRKDTTAIERDHTLVHAVRTARQATLLIRRHGPVIDPAYEAADVGLEELVLGYMGQHGDPAPGPPVRDRRRPMTWVVWRQHRSQAFVAAAAFAVLAVVLLITGRQMASQYQSALASCSAGHACGNLANTLTIGSPGMFLLVTLTVVVPCVLGVFWGGPLVARELETGTNQFAWMQGVSRRRWLATQVGWVLLAAAVWGGAVSALVTWWSSPVNALKQQNFQPGQFDIQGIVPVGYAVFAVALGITAGALLAPHPACDGRHDRRLHPAAPGGRPGPALALPDGGHQDLQLPASPGAAGRLLLARLGRRARPGRPGRERPQPQSGPGISFDGVPIPLRSMPSACRTLAFENPREFASCMAGHGYRALISYQPASRYWTFQGIETAIYLALAAILVTVAAIVVARRDA